MLEATYTHECTKNPFSQQDTMECWLSYQVLFESDVQTHMISFQELRLTSWSR